MPSSPAAGSAGRKRSCWSASTCWKTASSCDSRSPGKIRRSSRSRTRTSSRITNRRRRRTRWSTSATRPMRTAARRRKSRRSVSEARVIDRRRFLQAIAALAASTKLHAAQRASIGVQFFTFNRVAAEGWEQFSAAMKTARDIGYEGIQFAGLMGHAPDKISKRAEELGLKLRSMHIGNDQVRAFRAPDGPFTDAQDAVYTPQGIVQLARVNVPLARDLGCEWAVLAASGPANMQSLDSVMRMCEAMNRANEIVRRAGLKLSFHNHAPEFRALDGR